jgi:hypothetical protein
MFVRVRRRLGGAAFVVLLLAFGVQPVLADTERGHTGTVGFHRLRDSSSRGGASCVYTSVEPEYPDVFFYEGRLDWIGVEPPKVRAIAGPQEVGWRFIVQRRYHADLGGGWQSWKVRYRSPIQRAVTDSTTNAPFTAQGVSVIVPWDAADSEYQYQVLAKMYWFSGDGTVSGTATHRVDWYRSVHNGWPPGDGGDVRLDDRPCDPWVVFSN